MQLVVCEKPSVAEKIASAVATATGKTAKKKRLFSVGYYEVGEFFVASAVGHVYSLKQKTRGGDYPVFDIEWLPAWQVSESSAFTKNYLRVLESLAKKSDAVVNACDFDVEGSLIGWNVTRFLAPGKPVKRMKFSVLTEAELAQAFEELLDLDLQNALAGEARHKLDWLYGINVSRALMAAVRKAGAFKVLSAGRVQGPALHLVASREREVRDFNPVPFWQIAAFYSDKEFKDVAFLHVKKKFWDEDEAKKTFAECEKTGTVTKVESKRVRQLAPPPYDLTTLQTDAYRCFGFTPARSLELAQRLYEAALISYPRTASQKLPAKLGLPKILAAMEKIPAYKELAGRLVKEKRFKPREGPKSDPAHPAIFVTGSSPGNLDRDQAKLYDLIAKRFLACFAEPAEKDSLAVFLRLGLHDFFAKGVTVTKQGWLEFFEPYAFLEEKRLPAFQEGQAVTVDRIELQDKETQPPKRFTPASIVRELERRSLGTKATRSQIVETLYARGYVRNQKSIEATALGLAVDETLERNCPEILSEDLTRHFEQELELIQSSEKEADEVVSEGRKELTGILEKFKAHELVIGKDLNAAVRETRREESVLGACECGGNLVFRKSKHGVFVGCDKYPECKNTYPLPGQASIKSTGKACGKCGTPIVWVRRRGKRPWRMCLDPGCETKKSWAKSNAG